MAGKKRHKTKNKKSKAGPSNVGSAKENIANSDARSAGAATAVGGASSLDHAIDTNLKDGRSSLSIERIDDGVQDETQHGEQEPSDPPMFKRIYYAPAVPEATKEEEEETRHDSKKPSLTDPDQDLSNIHPALRAERIARLGSRSSQDSAPRGRSSNRRDKFSVADLEVPDTGTANQTTASSAPARPKSLYVRPEDTEDTAYRTPRPMRSLGNLSNTIHSATSGNPDFNRRYGQIFSSNPYDDGSTFDATKICPDEPHECNYRHRRRVSRNYPESPERRERRLEREEEERLAREGKERSEKAEEEHLRLQAERNEYYANDLSTLHNGGIDNPEAGPSTVVYNPDEVLIPGGCNKTSTIASKKSNDPILSQDQISAMRKSQDQQSRLQELDDAIAPCTEQYRQSIGEMSSPLDRSFTLDLNRMRHMMKSKGKDKALPGQPTEQMQQETLTEAIERRQSRRKPNPRAPAAAEKVEEKGWRKFLKWWGGCLHFGGGY